MRKHNIELRRLLTLAVFLACFSFVHYGQWITNTTPTYPELIRHLKALDDQHDEIQMYAMGKSDYGLPIYVCILNGEKDSISTFIKAKENTTILINNAIHAGEPDGVNACLQWIDDWIKQGKPTKNIPVIAIIPGYNVGGMMMRNSNSRTNQNGPEEYGFRGNAQNLDLNRDFIKMDSKNSFVFAHIFHALSPDVFVDTHVSNGADYQYTLTYIPNLRERLTPAMEELTYEKCIPHLEKTLRKKKWDLFPYVELKGENPDTGIYAFNDLPRYAMGYAGLFHSLSFTVETHMLKPFQERVQSTYDFLDELIRFTKENQKELELARQKSFEHVQNQPQFSYDFQLSDKQDSIWFKGFEHSYPISPISGLPQLKYHPERIDNRWIPYFNTYKAQKAVKIPDFFYVGGQCSDVIDRLKANGIAMNVIARDSTLVATEQRILSFESNGRPYEGHFYHKKVEVTYENNAVRLKPGDVIIDTKQPGRLFLMSVLMADAEDSYFRWNAFDSYLQQKEYFSAYVFEEKAREILEKDNSLRERLEIERAKDEQFKQSHQRQLEFIYKNSPHFEPSYNLIPIYYR